MAAAGPAFLQFDRKPAGMAGVTIPRSEEGDFEIDGTPVAYDVLLDSVGSEVWSLFIGYTSAEQFHRWEARKAAFCMQLAERAVAAAEGARNALERLWRTVDRAIDLDDFRS